MNITMQINNCSHALQPAWTSPETAFLPELQKAIMSTPCEKYSIASLTTVTLLKVLGRSARVAVDDPVLVLHCAFASC